MDLFKFDPEQIFEDTKVFGNPKSGTESREMLSRPLKQIRDFVNSLVAKLYSKEEVNQIIADAQFKSGSADMFKAQYDADGDGIVDNAKMVNGHTVEKDVPANANFTYEPASESDPGLMSAEDFVKLQSVPRFYSGGTFVEPADWNVNDVYWVIEE